MFINILSFDVRFAYGRVLGAVAQPGFKSDRQGKISAGGLAATAVDIRCILREALMKRAVSMALCHNHPSGSLRPSREDDCLTEHLDKAAKIMNIRLIDHVILTDGKYYSYADEGRI